MDEEFSAPVDLLPPAWMKHCTIAPAQQMPGKNMGGSENSVPLNPMVNDHYPY